MITGYEKPLYILPFDHRHSYITGVFHWQEPLTPGQVAEIVASKQVIYDGFKAAVADGPLRDRSGILVDETFGAAVLHDAAARGYKEKGSINTPLGLTILNQVDRFSLAIDVIDRVPRLKDAGAHVKAWLQDQILEHLAYANEHGVDTPEIQNWKWTP